MYVYANILTSTLILRKLPKVRAVKIEERVFSVLNSDLSTADSDVEAMFRIRCIINALDWNIPTKYIR